MGGAVEAPAVKPLGRGIRLVLLAGTASSLGGILPFALARDTDRFFSWTIEPPLTAAFLGANFLGSAAMTFMAARNRVWAQSRAVALGFFAFATLGLVNTLIHSDRFHFDSSHALARVVAWAWLILYVLAPIATLVALSRQVRGAGTDPVRTAPLPRWFRTTLAGQAAVLLILGIGLLIAPEGVGWPWELTALTGRFVGSWLLVLGIVQTLLVVDDDVARIRAAMVGLVFVGALQLIALVRFSGTPEWSQWGPWAFLGFVLLLMVVGAYGELLFRRASIAG